MKRVKKQKKEKTSVQVRKGISEKWYYAIRLIAIITMLTDHLSKVLYSTGNLSFDHLLVCNMIGRTAFPLFAFELVECYYHTSNWAKHLGKLGLLALISEIPFDMAMVFDKPLNFSWSAFDCQNTIVTLFVGFLFLKITDINWNNILSKFYKSKTIKKFATFSIKLTIFAAFAVLTAIIGCDYTWKGIILIALFNFAKKRKFTKTFQFIAMLVFVILMESSVMIYMTTFFCLIPIYLAECRKKAETNCEELEEAQADKHSLDSVPKALKLISTFFYPIHLVILTIVKIILM